MGILTGLKVLDLTWGISGPVTAMLLADHGAAVTKIEPPGGDPFRSLSGYQVWHRGKRSAVLDLKAAEDRDRFLALAAAADVVIESFSPGVTTRLGIDYDTLAASNPRLVYCSITGYGSDGKHADRPAIDALVAARTGHQWEAAACSGERSPAWPGSRGCCRASRRLRGAGSAPSGMARCSRACRGRAWRRSTWPRWRSAPRCGPGASPAGASTSRRRSCRGCCATTLGGWQRVEQARRRRTSRPG